MLEPLRRTTCRRMLVGAATWIGVAIAADIANAQPGLVDDSCKKRFDDLVAEWRSIAVPGSPPENARSARHGHTALEVWYMRGQLRLALRSCEQGDDHEAMLRMDVVRAWLKLPEVSHPADHWYHYDEPDSK